MPGGDPSPQEGAHPVNTPIDLGSTVAQLIETARSGEHGRAAQLVAHDGPLRQSVVALVDGVRLAEHNSPPAASLQVLSGRVRVELGDDVQAEAATGELLVLTHERHAVLALEDSAFLLTTVTGVEQGSHR